MPVYSAVCSRRCCGRKLNLSLTTRPPRGHVGPFSN
jgi:hypothetical protein